MIRRSKREQTLKWWSYLTDRQQVFLMKVAQVHDLSFPDGLHEHVKQCPSCQRKLLEIQNGCAPEPPRVGHIAL